MSFEREESTLKLQLEWIKTADSKVPPIFAINLAMLGFLMTTIQSVDSTRVLPGISSCLTILLLIISLVCLGLAMFPRLNGPESSNIFFGGIAKQEESEYLCSSRDKSDVDYQTDILRQTYVNASIAAIKYKFISCAFKATFTSIPFWLFAVYSLYV